MGRAAPFAAERAADAPPVLRPGDTERFRESFMLRNLDVVVAKRAHEADAIVSFELRAIGEQTLPAFTAGSHLDVHITCPAGTALTRQYSLCNDPSERHRYLIAVLRDPSSRGGSIALHDHLNEGDTLTISEPKNHFPLVPAAHTVLLAGGIGITPLLSMAERLSRTGANFTLHYCTRSLTRTAFTERIARSPFADRVKLHVDDGEAAQQFVAARELGVPTPDRHVYICGPAGYLDHVLGAARGLGWPDGQLHLEYFGARPADAASAADEEAFDVTLASSGQTYRIPAGQSITQVLAGSGIHIPVSCEQGVCGTCITRVLAGDCDHRDMFLTAAEHKANDQMTPCCSRARSSRLVLDL